MSNIATALVAEPRLRDLIPELVIMGGADRYGNVTPRAEFNVWADPEAARIVFRSGIRKITLVPLDATHRHSFRSTIVPLSGRSARLRVRQPPCSPNAGSRATTRTQPMKRPNAAPVHDALAVASIVDPAVITTTFLHVDVETTGELTVGETVVDTNHRGDGAPNVHIALEADERRFVDLLLATLARTP